MSQARVEWTAERKAFVRRAWLQGYTALAIANRLGQPVTRNAVIGLIHRHHWERPMDVKPKREPPPPIQPKTPPPPPPEGLLFEDLLSHHCRWPSGHGAPYTFCGQNRDEGSSYCAAHTTMAAPAGGRR